MKKLLAMGMLFWSGVALAHVHGFTEAQNRALKDVFSKGGTNCCTVAEAAPIKDPDWGVEDGKFWVFLEGERRPVHPDAVVVQPNPTGVALVWTVRYQGHIQIKCFAPGQMG